MLNRVFLLLIVLVAIVGVAFLFWKEILDPCISPVKITRLEDETNIFQGDKSGAKRQKIADNGELVIYEYLLEERKQNRATFDTKEGAFLQILKGEATLYSAKFGEKGELDWFNPLPIREGDYVSIPPKIVYQIESHENPLSYLMFSSKNSQEREREFLREEHPLTVIGCDAENIPEKENGSKSISPTSEGDHHPVEVVEMGVVE